ncbi:MAG: hypothetical protein AAB375_03535 [Patescibacteria group bacterium]
MATISREIAEQQIARCKKQKRPRMYCIAKYWNLEFQKYGYSLCYTAREYEALLNSSVVEGVTILWSSRSRKER